MTYSTQIAALKMSNVHQFCVGDSFSYTQLKEAIKEFERVNYMELCHRDSKTLAAAKTEERGSDKSESIGKRPRQKYT